MSSLYIGLTAVCVFAICIGQILFKYVGSTFQSTGVLLDLKLMAILTLALTIYVGATILWIYLLRFVPLSKAYPYMALSFVLVPIFSAVFFGESLSQAYFIGTVLILMGLLIVTRYG